MEQPTPRKDRVLERFLLFLLIILPGILAIVLGGGLVAGTIYALDVRIRHLVDTASVDPDPAVWVKQARTFAYDRCYNGCRDATCLSDPDAVAKACARTAKAGATCDAARMWNWRDGRYQDHCLAAVGDMFKADALHAKKMKLRQQYAIIILCLLGGLVLGWVTYKLAKRYAAGWRHRLLDRGALRDLDQRGGAQEPELMPREEKVSRPHEGRSRVKTALLVILAFFGKKTQAFPCAGYGTKQWQTFENANRTVIGFVQGWMSDCYHYQSCYSSCSESCSTSGGTTSCHTTCRDSCTTHTGVRTYPDFYVSRAAKKVVDCGFHLIDQLNETVDARVANAGIESNYWVTIVVNAYNVTSPGVTDDDVWCLYNIGNTKP
ncbi:uncharacterized protein E0L32_004097 [Thyridium curvatum]|uniref:Uncharacterized protein n=1 Tax=Thyridium curvatum TaxID=1093900 RepID=A0A507B1F4_9PEZI|nr:uncharacterized protein E0L32_004097 [Thyridium curvatum]TPX16102.1 hypothetical protein E0L32_004097 [Thyridium curvatum]